MNITKRFRYNRKAYGELLRGLWVSQGGVCTLCKKPMAEPNQGVGAKRERPTIHHPNHDTDNPTAIVEAVHYGCNSREYAQYVKRLLLEDYANHSEERERKAEANRIFLEKLLPRFKIVPRDSDSYSNKKHEEAMPIYRQYWFARVIYGFKHQEAYEPSALTAGACEMAGLTLVTAYRDNARLFGPLGPLETADEGVLSGGAKTGKEVAIFKDASHYFLSVDELMELYPIQGQRAVDPKRSAALLEEATTRWQVAENAKVKTNQSRQEARECQGDP